MGCHRANSAKYGRRDVKIVARYRDTGDKVPFWARFTSCAGQLTAIRDEGRDMPLPRADLDKLIGEYRERAIEVQACSAGQAGARPARLYSAGRRS